MRSYYHFFNRSWWSCFHQYCAPGFLPYCKCSCVYCVALPYTLLSGLYSLDTHRVSIRTLLFGFQAVGQMCSDQIYFSLLPHPKIHHRNYIGGIPIHTRDCLSDRSMMVQVECLHTALFPKALYRPTMRCRQVCRPSHISKALGGVLFHCSMKFQYLHGSWFLVHAPHLSEAGWSWPAWDPSFTGSGVANPVVSGLTSFCCFDSKLDRFSN